MKFRMRAVAAAIALIGTSAAWAGEPEAQKWIDSEFQPSTLSGPAAGRDEVVHRGGRQLKAQGVNEINVVSETITTHEYESKTLAKAFSEITGIKVTRPDPGRRCGEVADVRASPSTTAGFPIPT